MGVVINIYSWFSSTVIPRNLIRSPNPGNQDSDYSESKRKCHHRVEPELLLRHCVIFACIRVPKHEWHREDSLAVISDIFKIAESAKPVRKTVLTAINVPGKNRKVRMPIAFMTVLSRWATKLCIYMLEWLVTLAFSANSAVSSGHTYDV